MKKHWFIEDEACLAAWRWNTLVVGQSGDYWKDATTTHYGGVVASELACLAASVNRLVDLDDDGFFPNEENL